MRALDPFSPPVRAWFEANFDGPTPPQAHGWPTIAAGSNTLILAPTGSGKTLSAFLWGIDRLIRNPTDPDDLHTRIIYVSPLRALAVDVDKNLRAPLEGIADEAARLGVSTTVPTVGVRTGDTSAQQRRQIARRPPDILITTPESLYLMLTSQVREKLTRVEAVIIDEIHALVGTKRGAHLALTLERLAAATNPPAPTPAAPTAAAPTPPAPTPAAPTLPTPAPPAPNPTAPTPPATNTPAAPAPAAPAPAAPQTSNPLSTGHSASTTTAPTACAVPRPPLQRIGLSATQRPLEETARFLGGHDGNDWRRVEIVDAGITKQLDLRVVVPVEDMSDLGQVESPPNRGGAMPTRPATKSIWPAIHPRLLDLIEDHRSTLIFVNNRRLAERLAARLNELADERRLADPDPDAPPPGVGPAGGMPAGGMPANPPPPDPASQPHGDDDSAPVLVKAHHGSISRAQRTLIEEQLKQGTLKGLVATSSLELGIDMGAIDLVVQVESPGAVSRGLQRIGRAGHNVGDTSRGKIFPKHRADLLEATVVAQRMQAGQIESTLFLRNPLDVLAQQVVAMCALDDWSVDDLSRVVRGAANFVTLSDDVLHSVLDLLAGRYPSERFAELRPRIVWDRVDGQLRGRRGAQRLAVTNAGTIPDRGLFGVFLADGTRVGELDEEMVYESRPGEVFLLGATSWRIEEITFERVVVSPATGVPARMPFWRGDGPGRPRELGDAIGQFVRDLRRRDAPVDYLIDEVGLDAMAATNLVGYLDDQAAATGVVPDDQTIVIERFRDEIGDWRVCVHTPFGAQVHAPWAIAVRSRLQEHYGNDIEMIWSDDGIVVRLPEHAEQLPTDAFAIDPAVIDRLVVDELPHTALFAARFRESAGRALLLPRRRPDQRTPLWQQRQRAADLLDTARDFPDFPILLETVRECVTDVFDLPALRSVLSGIGDESIRLVMIDTDRASPFAQSLLFGWIAVYMYEGDAPLAERRAAALELDQELLAELLGPDELRRLLDADVLADLERELQRLTPERQARDADELHDLLRELGPLTRSELAERSATPRHLDGWLDRLLERARAFETSFGGEARVAASDDAARLRDGFGVKVPSSLPAAFLEPADSERTDVVAQARLDLVERFARTHGPFTTDDVARRYGVTGGQADAALAQLETAGRLLRGEFHPAGTDLEWCDPDILRRLRRRSLAELRRRVEPVPPASLARFLPRWQGVGTGRIGVDGLVDTLAVLQGAPIPASILERDVLSVRLADYRSADLDSLCTSGQVVWIGDGSLAHRDGRIRLLFRDHVPLLAPAAEEPLDGPTHQAIRELLATRGASFWPDLVRACADADISYQDDDVLAGLWELVWNGEVTNDTLAPVRALLAGSAPRANTRRSSPPGAAGLAGPAGQGPPRPSGRGRTRRGGVRRRLASARPRPGQLQASGPASAVGRWSLVAPLLLPRPAPTVQAHARAQQLLDRYGVLTREATLGEGSEGGFAGVYPILRALEDQGTVRRGYFVDGLGAAQFALAGAVDRLRRPGVADEAPVVLAAADPAQPYGAALDWPACDGRPSRRTGALVVLHAGAPLVYVERGGKSLLSFTDAPINPAWAPCLADAVRSGRTRLEIAKINGEPAAQSPLIEYLEGAGFTRGYRGWVVR